MSAAMRSPIDVAGMGLGPFPEQPQTRPGFAAVPPEPIRVQACTEHYFEELWRGFDAGSIKDARAFGRMMWRLDRAIEGIDAITRCIAEDERARLDAEANDEVDYQPMTPVRLECLRMGLDLLVEDASGVMEKIRMQHCRMDGAS